MLHFNPIPYQRRLKELFYDYFVIIAYLLTLFILAMGFYFLVFGKIPNFTEGQSQLIATILSVLPIILIFTFMGTSKYSIKLRFCRYNCC